MRSSILPLILVAAAACSVAVATASPARVSFESAGMDAALEGRIERLVEQSIDRGNMPGCVVLIGRRAGIVLEKAYGNRAVEPEIVPMTTDTVFDMASLTKPVATATSVMILIERGQLRLQDKVAKFFPEFAAKGKENVTIEQLLIHSGGLIPDNALEDYDEGWKSAKPKICDLEASSEPGERFKYSDVGFILLGKIIEEVSSKPVNEFAKEEVFGKLGMNETGYLPPDELKARAAPTEKRDGEWLVGVVHDPRAAKMDCVAGHAGLFSTAQNMATYATMMLNRGRHGDTRLLSAATVEEMIRPRNIRGQRRALGWDNQTGYSRNRGELMSRRAFGHGGFTGTAMWIDPELDLYVIFLSSRLHPDSQGEVNDLAGRIGTIACAAITRSRVSPKLAEKKAAEKKVSGTVPRNSVKREPRQVTKTVPDNFFGVQLGIDVLAADGFKQLEGKRVGLITNHTGMDSAGKSTADLLHEAPNVKLVALFGPEHGVRGTLDHDGIADSVDEATGLPVYSLYGETRKPTEKHLAGIDVLVFDIQDVGARFYTYTSTMFMAMEAAAAADIEFVVLDRPNPIGGEIIEGPLLDAGRESFVGYHPIPVRHGMTIGELARMFAKYRKLDVELTVIEMKGWRRGQYLFDTGLRWTNPSPNMRSLEAALLYPGIGLLETTNVSVGRGTDTPFEVMGAPWIHERELAEMVNAANPPGVRVVPVRFTPTSSKHEGKECGGLNFVITDWNEFRSFELGLVVAHALRKLYRDEWETKPYMRLLGNEEVYRRLLDGDDVASILTLVEDEVGAFRARRRAFELYE
ncbi:MAG TPA: exo-beta-N-acetylmuramidase NamZ domain-containing protein [Lacipirellulaceae bacterium]